MAQGMAYWISPKKIIYRVDLKHVDFVRQNLQLFGMTFEEYQDYFLRHKQPIGWEGIGREEMFIDIMKKGWIRVREWADKGWSVETWELDRYAKDAIFDWAAKTSGLIESMSSFSTKKVNIHIIKLEREKKPQSMWHIDTNMEEILKGKLYETTILNYDEYMNENVENNEPNYLDVGRVDEASLSRVWKKTTENDFAFFTAFRGERDYKENVRLLNNIIKDLNTKKMGPYLIDGHYPETIDGKVVDSSENSIMIVRPDDMNINEFMSLVMEYISDPKWTTGKTKDGKVKAISQESALLGFVTDISSDYGVKEKGYYLMYPGYKWLNIGNKLTFNKMGEMYSKMKGHSVPFVFEGLRIPNQGMLSGMSYKTFGLKYE